MKNTVFVVICLLLSSCDWFERGGFEGHPRNEDTENGKRDESPDGLTVSAVSFPEDYDWRKDTAYSNVVGASLLLLKGDDTLVMVPCGKEGLARTDADMHHILGSHLVTEYPLEEGTAISMDGKELFRYPVKESLRGLAMKEGKLYTLGQNRSGNGFSLRIDGKEVFSEDSGYLLGDMYEMGYGPEGALYWDNSEGPYFSFCIIEGVSGKKQWYVYEKGAATLIDLPEGCEYIFDARIIRSELYYISSSGGLPALFRNGYLERNLSIEGEAADDYRIASINGKVYVYGTYNYVISGHRRDSDREWACSAIWDSEGEMKVYEGMGWIYPSADSITFQRFSKIPEGYSVFNYNCCYFDGKDMFLALSPKADTLSPCLHVRGKGYNYCFNGFLSGIGRTSD